MSRLARALSVLALGAISIFPAAFARADAPAPTQRWRFQSASAVSAAPAVASTGNVYLASVEGVVHAVAADGRLRWSHGVSGMPIGEPALDPRERVYVATSALRLYSFHADGRLRWRRPARARVRSGAVWLESGRVLYLGGERSLQALSAFGDALDIAPTRADTLLAAPGLVAAISSGERGRELWRWSGARRAQRLPLPPSVAVNGDAQLLAAGGRSWLLSGGELYALEAGASPGVGWSVAARGAAVSEDGQTVLIDSGSELRWLSASSGEVAYRAPLSEAASAAPAVGNDGLALVPLVTGELLLASPGSAELGRVRVGSAPLLRPIWSEERGQVTIAAGDGALVVLQLRGWPPLEAPHQQREPSVDAVAHSPKVGQ